MESVTLIPFMNANRTLYIGDKIFVDICIMITGSRLLTLEDVLRGCAGYLVGF
jgi:hypothetical protein